MYLCIYVIYAFVSMQYFRRSKSDEKNNVVSNGLDYNNSVVLQNVMHANNSETGFSK